MKPETTVTLAVVGMPSILALCLVIFSLSSSVFSGIFALYSKKENN